MVIVDIIAALIMGALSGMGVGGGGLLVIYLTAFKSLGQIASQGINLYFFIFASVASLFVHCRKRKINYKAVVLLSGAGIPFAIIGSVAASVTDPETVRTVFGIMLILAGAVTLFKGSKEWLLKKRNDKK